MLGGEIVTTARFHPTGRWITVSLEVGTHSLSMVLDTGAPLTTLSPKTRYELAELRLLRPSGRPNLHFLTQVTIEAIQCLTC